MDVTVLIVPAIAIVAGGVYYYQKHQKDLKDEAHAPVPPAPTMPVVVAPKPVDPIVVPPGEPVKPPIVVKPVDPTPVVPVDVPPQPPAPPPEPGPVPVQFNGSDLWRKASVWRAQVPPGGHDARSFTVPEGYEGVIEYMGDHAAIQGFMDVFIDGQPVVGGRVFLSSGVHSISVFGKENPAAPGYWPVGDLSIVHNP